MTDSLLSNIVVINIKEPIDRFNLLKILSDEALARDWVKPGYIDAVMTREKKYPTGLHTRGVEVAIPHADPEWTLVPGLVVGILDVPAVFEPMGGEGDDVLARFVFLLLIPDADAHLNFLQTLAEFIEDENRLKSLEETNDINPLLDYFKQNLKA